MLSKNIYIYIYLRENLNASPRRITFDPELFEYLKTKIKVSMATKLERGVGGGLSCRTTVGGNFLAASLNAEANNHFIHDLFKAQ